MKMRQRNRLPAVAKRRRLAGIAVPLFAAALMLAACSTTEIITNGNAPEADKLAQIKAGRHTRAEVSRLLGSPSNVAAFSKDTWYYISKRSRTAAYHRTEILSREIVAITFDDQGRVKEVQNYDLADGRKIKPVERVTPTPGREFTILQQLFGNLGRFDPSGAATRAPDSTNP